MSKSVSELHPAHPDWLNEKRDEALGLGLKTGRYTEWHATGAAPLPHYADWPDAPLPAGAVWMSYDPGAEAPLPDEQLRNGGACS